MNSYKKTIFISTGVLVATTILLSVATKSDPTDSPTKTELTKSKTAKLSSDQQVHAQENLDPTPPMSNKSAIAYPTPAASNSLVSAPLNEEPSSSINSLTSEEPLPISPFEVIEGWESTDEVPARFEDLVEPSVDRRFVRYSTKQLKSLALGDRVNLNIPQLTANYEAEIEEVIISDNGDHLITGRSNGEYGETHTAIITVGSIKMFGTINSAKGVYEMEGIHGDAWIISSRDINILSPKLINDAVIFDDSKDE